MYQLRLSVLEILDGHLYDSLCILCRILRAEADELCIRHLCNRGSGHEFGVEALGQRPKCRENTLNVNDDCLTGSGQNYILLLQEVTCHRNTTTHCYFVGGTADTGYR